MSDISSIRPATLDRLTKLFTLGKEVKFSDESGDILLFIRKVTPVESRDAIQESLKARATLLALARADSDDPIKQGYSELIQNLGLDTRESQIQYTCDEELVKLRISIEERIANEPKWSKDDYLIALQEAWFNGGMRERYLKDNEDEDASRIFNAMKEYSTEVEEAFEFERDDVIAAKEDWSDEKLLEECTRKFILRHASNEQNEEAKKWQIYFATFVDPEYKTRLFPDRKTIDDHPELYKMLAEEYEEMCLNDIEGKG